MNSPEDHPRYEVKCRDCAKSGLREKIGDTNTLRGTEYDAAYNIWSGHRAFLQHPHVVIIDTQLNRVVYSFSERAVLPN